jgi:hypothetical protein
MLLQGTSTYCRGKKCTVWGFEPRRQGEQGGAQGNLVVGSWFHFYHSRSLPE